MQTAWQSLQLPPFRAIHYDDGFAPLQIRSFTSESYEVIKRRERKAEKRGQRNYKQRSDAQTRDLCNCRYAMLECAASDFKWQDRASMDLMQSQHTERVIQNGRAAQTDTELEAIPASPATTSTDLLEGQTVSGTSSSASALSLADGAAVSIDYGSEANAEHQQASPDDAHRISVGHDDLSAVSVEFENPAPHYEEHTLATSPQMETGIATPQDLTAIDYRPIPEVTITEEHITLNGPKAAAVPFSYAGDSVQSDLPSSWSSEQDELLLHLRDVAQLDWPNIGSYYPTTLLDTLKHRHRQLCLPKTNQRSSTVLQKRKSTSPTTHWAPSSKSRKTVARESTKSATFMTSHVSEHVIPRTSRRGRPIKHPFRHRPSEGYLQ